MPIRLRCLNPECARPLEFDDELAGSRTSCLGCMTELLVPIEGAMVGREFDGYHVLEMIGKGGAGQVYRVRHLESAEEYAMKVLDFSLATDALLVKRFEREARVTAMMEHKNIVRGYGLFRNPDTVYIVMELMLGETARDRMKRKGKLELRETLKIALAVVRGLQHACEHGVVHRDVKPSNILIDTEGHIKLADFGLVRMEDATMQLTRGKFMLGTPLYTPPEQSEDARWVDHRSDMYALGVSVMHLLTGQHPFAAPSLQLVKESHATRSMPTGAELGTPLPEELESVLQKMTAKLPADRYQDYDDLERDIERLLVA